MRNWIIYLVFCLFSFKALSQNFNYDIHSEFNSVQANMLLHKNNLYFTSKRHQSGSSQILDFYSYTKAGAFRFKKSIALSEGHDVAKLIVTNDSNIAFFGQYYICDVATQYPFLIKTDTNGQVLLSKTFTASPMVNNVIIDGCQLSNNNYYFISKSRIFNINSLGNYVSASNVFDTLSSITQNNNGNNLLINATSPFFNQAVSIYKLTPSLAISNSYTTSNRYKKIIQNKGSYFGLTNQGYVEKLDTTFQVTGNTMVLQNFSSGNSITDFIVNQDTVYAVGYKNNYTSSMLVRADTNLVLISNNQNNSPKHLSKSISVNNSSAFILADDNDIIPHISLTSVPKNSMYSFNNNIKLSPVAIDSSFAINTYSYSNGGEFIDIKFKATIKNMSNVQLNSFYLTANLGSFSGYCYKKLFHKNFNGLSIAPGDSITVSTDSIIGLLTTYYFPNYVTLSNICFVVTAPNGQNDLDATDNTSCPGIVVNPTGIRQNNNAITELSIYPNPVNDILTIVNDGNFGFTDGQIINNVGQVVEEFNLNFNNKESQIALTGLPNGVYSLNLKTIENVIVNKRLIIAR
ncbi:MAG: T9SS type A sorting domain-containing protein [Bacteroidota bacterium]|nr:T9SS type A sorting domain-containing protein [Bacteroidota bacterium]